MLMYIKDGSGKMHAITDTGDLRPVVNRKNPPTIRIIRKEDLHGKTARIKITPTLVKSAQRKTTLGVPRVTTEQVALRFRQNWLAKYPMDTCGNGAVHVDDSLTDLSWLQNLNVPVFNLPSSIQSPSPVTVTDNTQVNPNAVLNMVQSPICSVSTHQCVIPPLSIQDKIDYRTNSRVKPPYSYAQMICMAMEETAEKKMTLSSIYNWVTENFAYYRHAEPTWQNSIRHNLSLNKSFEKVPRQKNEPGKGGFWRINPELSDSLQKKRQSYPTMHLPPMKRIKLEVDDASYNNPTSNGGLTDSAESAQEDCSNPFQNFPVMLSDDENGDDMPSGEFNWSSLLDQDIQIDGMTIKTEDLLDETGGNLASRLMEMNLPPSDSSTNDITLDDFFAQTLSSSDAHDSAIDFSSNDPLKVNGTGLQTPDWFNDMMKSTDKRAVTKTTRTPTAFSSGLHTPRHTPAYQDDGIAWDHHDIPAAFDMDNLFDIDSIPNPQL